MGWPVPQSHTATQQWQSFEMRMRQRRADRCLLRASVALDAGVIDDAREALDEVRRLDPDNPQVAELTARIAAIEAAPLAEAPFADAAFAEAPFRDAPFSESRFMDAPLTESLPSDVDGDVEEDASNRSARWLAVAVLAIAASAALGWFVAGTFSRPAPAPSPAPVAKTAAPAPDVVVESAVVIPSAPESAAADAQPPTDTTNATVPTTGVAAAISTPGARAAQATRQAEATSVQAPAVASSAPIAVPPPLPAARTDEPAPIVRPLAEAVAPAPSLSDAPAPPPAVPTAGIAETLPLRATPGEAAPPAAPPPAPALTDDRQVRAILSRYEAAYSQLDAAAAAAVFPGIDRRSLARAFDGLVSQRLSLGRCDVLVNGAAAQATCNGTAQWTPKVGGGTQSSARRWRFDLKNTGANWIIVDAIVR